MILRTARRDFEDVVWAANSKTNAHKCGAPAGPFWAAPSDVVLYYHRSLAAAEAFAMPLLSAHVFASPAWRSRPKMAPGAAFPAEELRHWRPWQWTAKSSTAEPPVTVLSLTALWAHNGPLRLLHVVWRCPVIPKAPFQASSPAEGRPLSSLG